MITLAKNPFGLLATTTDQTDGPREHTEHQLRTATVMFGPTLPDPGEDAGIEYWPTPEMAPGYDFEAIYNPASISGAAAKAKFTALLAAKGIRPEFITEDHLCGLCCKDLSNTAAKVPNEGNAVGTDGQPIMRCEPKCRRTVDDIAAERKQYLGDCAELRQLGRERGTMTPAMERFMDEVESLLASSSEPAATFDKVLAVISDARARKNGCPVHDWCTEREPGHIDHSRYERGIVQYGAVHLSASTPKLCVGNAEFPMEQAGEKAAELRLIADRLEVWAGFAGTAR